MWSGHSCPLLAFAFPQIQSPHRTLSPWRLSQTLSDYLSACKITQRKSSKITKLSRHHSQNRNQRAARNQTARVPHPSFAFFAKEGGDFDL